MHGGEPEALWPRAAAIRFRSSDPRALRWEACFDRSTGLGSTAALVDTGLDWAAPIFRGLALDYVDLLGTGASRDPSGHGTRSAAVLLCPTPGNGLALAGGLALTVFGALGGGPRTVARALRAAATRRVRIVVLPFGRLLPDTAVAEALLELRATGAEILAAAGNRGPESILYPASGPNVIAVSALGPGGAVLPECPEGSSVALLAPGLVRCPLDGRMMRGSSTAVVMAAGLRALASTT